MACSDCELRGSVFFCKKAQNYITTRNVWDHCVKGNPSACNSGCNENGGCYLETACIIATDKGSDDLEMGIIRDFMRTYMEKNEEGRAELRAYAKSAPQILKTMNRENNTSVFCCVYDKMVMPLLQYITKKEYQTAQTYFHTIRLVMEKEYIGG